MFFFEANRSGLSGNPVPAVRSIFSRDFESLSRRKKDATPIRAGVKAFGRFLKAWGFKVKL